MDSVISFYEKWSEKTELPQIFTGGCNGCVAESEKSSKGLKHCYGYIGNMENDQEDNCFCCGHELPLHLGFLHETRKLSESPEESAKPIEEETISDESPEESAKPIEEETISDSVEKPNEELIDGHQYSLRKLIGKWVIRRSPHGCDVRFSCTTSKVIEVFKTGHIQLKEILVDRYHNYHYSQEAFLDPSWDDGQWLFSEREIGVFRKK